MFFSDVDNHVVMILGPNPIDKVSGAINNCSRKVGEATRHAENMVDNIWNHGEFSSFSYSPIKSIYGHSC